MKRSKARENAFILVFEKSINDSDIEDIITGAEESCELAMDGFTISEFKGVYDNLSDIDALIEKNCVGWKLSRISKVALAAMRICCFELLFDKEIPESVSINEAIELTKKYAGEEDASYVNGVLGSVVKSLS